MPVAGVGEHSPPFQMMTGHRDFFNHPFHEHHDHTHFLFDCVNDVDVELCDLTLFINQW